MSFRFALQPLLDARARAEADARTALYVAGAEAARARLHVAQLRAERARLGAVLQAASSGVESGACRDAAFYAEVLGEASARAERSARDGAQRVATARDAHAAARRALRQIELLRDRALEAQRAAGERRDEAARDDANAAAHCGHTLRIVAPQLRRSLRRMMDITGNLEAGVMAGKAGLAAAATRVATANTGPSSQRDFEGPMKETVRREMFAEALLGAAHARFEEVKTAAESQR